jgi:hypothetical protein
MRWRLERELASRNLLRPGFPAQSAVFNQEVEMIEGAANQGLKMAPFEIYILGRVNSDLLGVAQGFGSQDAESDNQDIG